MECPPVKDPVPFNNDDVVGWEVVASRRRFEAGMRCRL